MNDASASRIAQLQRDSTAFQKSQETASEFRLAVQIVSLPPDQNPNVIRAKRRDSRSGDQDWKQARIALLSTQQIRVASSLFNDSHGSAGRQ